MDTQKYRFSKIVEFRMPVEFRKYVRAQMRHEAGNKLLDLLEEQKLPAVVDFKESVRKVSSNVPYQIEPNDIFEIELSFTPVQHQHIAIASQPFMDYRYIKPRGLLDKILSWFR